MLGVSENALLGVPALINWDARTNGFARST